MLFKNIKFRKGIRGSDPITLEDKKQIAFYGRSNVGKSSSINKILARNNLVKSSSTPGKTKEINFFEADERFLFVDLPGYGYAKLSKDQREKLRKMILWYIMFSEVKDRLNVIVLDARRGLSGFDSQIIDILNKQGEDIVLLFNKIDKFNQKEMHQAKKKILNEVKNNLDLIFFSAKTGKGVDEFYEILSNK